MPRKLSPEEATVMIIRRRLQQMEEDKIAQLESERDEEDLPERTGADERSGTDSKSE